MPTHERTGGRLGGMSGGVDLRMSSWFKWNKRA